MSAAPAPAPFPAAALYQATAGKIGLVHVDLPGYEHPVWLRAGAGDAGDCANFLPSFAARLQLDYRPRRILEIGAGAGFRSLALALAYPDAEILAFEADPACRRAALLNTLPCRNVTFYPEAQAALLAEQFAARGWDNYDTVIFQPQADFAPLLAAAWPASVRVLAVFTGGAALPAEAAAQFGQAEFTARQDGRYWVMSRRAPPTLDAEIAVPVFDTSGPLHDFALMNVSPESWGFFPIGAHGFRLHPNRGTGPTARLALSQHCQNYRKLTVRLRHGHKAAAAITFTVSVTTEPEGVEIFRAQQTVPGGEEYTLTGDMMPHTGPCRVIFATKMASMASKNDCAWAEFIDPEFA